MIACPTGQCLVIAEPESGQVLIDHPDLDTLVALPAAEALALGRQIAAAALAVRPDLAHEDGEDRYVPTDPREAGLRGWWADFCAARAQAPPAQPLLPGMLDPRD